MWNIIDEAANCFGIFLVTMGATLSAIKTLIVPALISLIFFLLLTFVLFPLWQRYRNRYSQYLPLDTISNRTSSIRARIQGTISRFMLPYLRRPTLSDRIVVAGRDSFDSEDGEELEDVDDSATERGRNSHETIDNTRRLSRDLEEGFMDDSDEESDTSQRVR